MSVALDICDDPYALKSISCIKCDHDLTKEEYDSLRQNVFESLQTEIDSALNDDNDDIVNIITDNIVKNAICSKCKMLKEKHELRFKQMCSNKLETEKDEKEINKIKELSNNYTWSYKGHHESNGMHCGQSCPCCRALMGADFGMCDICKKYQ
jgi:hypothetical protein